MGSFVIPLSILSWTVSKKDSYIMVHGYLYVNGFDHIARFPTHKTALKWAQCCLNLYLALAYLRTLVEFPASNHHLRIEREREAMMNNSRNLAGNRKQTSSGGSATTTSGGATSGGSSGSSAGSLKKPPRICRKKKLQLDFING